MKKINIFLPSTGLLKLPAFLAILFLGPWLFSTPILCKDLNLDIGHFYRPTATVQVPIMHTYVQSEQEIRSQNLVFLTSTEYQKALSADAIPLNSILILDEIPLGEDLPLVSAVIVAKELLLEATHIEVLADKIGIPLLYSQGVFANSKLRQLAKENSSFKLDCNNSNCTITGSHEIHIAQPKMQSILPLSFNRNVKKLYSYDVDRFAGRAQRELSGDKYFELMGFKIQFPHLVPDITSLSSGYFEDFLNNYSSAGEVLRIKYYQLSRNLEKARLQDDESMVKQLLSTFRQDILTSTFQNYGYDVFDEVVFELESYYHKIFENNINTLFSIRSNQDVEDLIAAGLYKSTVAQALTKLEIEKNIRKSWASLYEYRAYNIRRYWGQREDNLSTPLMIHPFIDGVLAHSVGSFKLNAKMNLELNINMVLGNNEKATNPSSTAKVVQLVVTDNGRGQPQIKIKSLAQGPITQSEIQLPKNLEIPILEFFKEVKTFIKGEFTFRTYVPSKIDIEFVIQKAEGFLGKPKIAVLQYKPSLNKEVVVDLLKGLLDRQDTDKKNTHKIKFETIENLITEHSLKSLGQALPEVYAQFLTQDKLIYYRYTLLIKDKKPFLLLWKTPVYHHTMKTNLARADVKWLKSGYISLKKASAISPKPRLIFTETTYSSEVDANLTVPVSAQLFKQALDIALIESPELHQLLLDQQPEIIFHTYEGNSIIPLPPKH